MKAIITFTVTILLITGIYRQEPKECNFFLIKETTEGVFIEKVKLFDSEMKVFEDKTLISYVMVFNPGSKSGEFIKAGEKLRSISAGLYNGEIRISITNADGSKKEMPSIVVDHAKNMNVRINITGYNGYKTAYRVENYESIKPDQGPVIDIFAGLLPISKGDYSMMTETHDASEKGLLTGSSELEIIRNWMVVNCRLPGGKEGKFILDIGAGTTVIESSMIDEEYQIRPFQTVEHSSEGIKISDAVIGGATGTVDNIMGVATLPNLAFGDIIIEDLDVTVLKGFPDGITQYGICGIIGRDILEQACKMRITKLNDAENASIEFLETSSSLKNSDHRLEYNKAGGHLFVDGKIHDVPASFLLDTGAGKLIIDKAYVKKNHIPYELVNDEASVITGLDGQGVEVNSVQIKNIYIGDIHLPELGFELSDLYIFETMGLENEAVLLGMEFFNDFSIVLFDFEEKNVHLWD